MEVLRKNITYKVIQELALIIELYEGDLTVEDIIYNKERIAESENYDSSYDLILDFRNADLQYMTSDIDRLVAFFKENTILHQKKKVAYLTSKPNEVVATTLFTFKIDDFSIEPKTFSTRDAVVAYLNIKGLSSMNLEAHIKELQMLTDLN